MGTLASQLKQRGESRRSEDLARYRAVMTGDAAADPDEVAALAERLGLSVDDVAADEAAVARWREIGGEMPDVAAAERAHHDAEAEYERVLGPLRERQADAERRRSAAFQERSRPSHEGLRTLRRDLPRAEMDRLDREAKAAGEVAAELEVEIQARGRRLGAASTEATLVMLGARRRHGELSRERRQLERAHPRVLPLP